jgi:hypothetical protein
MIDSSQYQSKFTLKQVNNLTNFCLTVTESWNFGVYKISLRMRRNQIKKYSLLVLLWTQPTFLYFKCLISQLETSKFMMLSGFISWRVSCRQKCKWTEITRVWNRNTMKPRKDSKKWSRIDWRVKIKDCLPNSLVHWLRQMTRCSREIFKIILLKTPQVFLTNFSNLA